MAVQLHTYETSPVVALHSSASNGKQWHNLAADLNYRFEVLAPNLPGYRPSPAESVSNGDASDQIIKEIERIGESVHLVGHSNGGAVALNVTRLRPDLVNSLTIYEPAAFHILEQGDERNRRLLREIKQLSGFVTASAAMGDAEGAMGRFIDFWNGDGTWRDLSQKNRTKFAGMVMAVLRDFTESFAQTWSLNELGDLDIPTLVMMGLDSPMVAQRTSIEIAHAIPGARIALLPELNHMAPIFQPEWVNPRILEHLSNAERPKPSFNWPTKRAA